MKTDPSVSMNEEPDPAVMASMLLRMPPHQIALFKAVIESYDNLATLRTEDPHNHYLRLYFAPESAGDVEELIASLSEEFSLSRLD
jgi:Domain of unknown function (DUF4911)